MRLLLVPVLLICASASLQAQDKKKCSETPVDSTNPGGSTACYRADFEFVVDTTGVPELSTVRRVASTDPVFAEAVEATIGRLRYEPARLDSAHVRQVVRYRNGLSMIRTVVASSPGGGFTPPSGSRMPRPPKC